MQKKIELIQKLADAKKIINELLQDEEFDYFSIQKKTETDAKLARFGSTQATTIYVSSILKHARVLNPRRTLHFLSNNFLDEQTPGEYDGAVFLLTNNDIGPNLFNYIDFYRRNENSIFIVWDWDPQHWTYMSCMLAMHCDFFISSASENAYMFSHFNPYVLGPVLGGVNQWTRKFLLENIPLLMAERSNEPMGEHAFYADFPKRNRAIQTITRKHPGVGFSDGKYTAMSDLENLQKWAGYKVHWIMPVLCGVPVRVHNAMITGGIPVVPSFYKNIPEIVGLGDVPLYYDTIDLVEPTRINALAVKKFDEAGENGLIERICSSIKHNHIDRRIEDIFVLLEDKLDQTKNDTREYTLGYFRQ
ncbi:MAG: hypothetical protein A3F78_09780 [Burkholderiales bacterium RIFCSPLOWO2_12_FULL_61_40]|nr:MAG: hypothetical protein A3F78_09780 [Burkholderiales bacterium RIFCSPLOWO2_12_FULL_61_40]